VIVALGLASDPTFRHFVTTARDRGIDLVVVDLRRLADGNWSIEPQRDAESWLELDRTRLSLDPSAGYYCRLIDLSPVLAEPESFVWTSMIGVLSLWLENVPDLVANVPRHGSHNSSKPLHEALLLGLGLDVPEAITSSDPADLIAFTKAGPAVCKSLCGARGDTRLVSVEDFARFRPDMGPVHLQRLVTGVDVRAHVVGEKVFCERIVSNRLDYRERGAANAYAETQLPADCRALLLSATRKLGLVIAGWDLKVCDDSIYCFEVNPMPGYSVYDARTGGGISDALFEFLSR
jgi:hypothetical protein